MYYPQSQITSNLYTNGGEFIYINTQLPYVGYYWKVSNGKYFTGKTPQDTPNEEIIKSTSDRSQVILDPTYSSTISEVALAYDAPYVYDENVYNESSILTYLSLKKISLIKPPTTLVPLFSATLPTEQDYQNTEFRRYFCKKTNEIIYLEISKETYDKLVAQDSQILFELYIPFNLPWQLTGDREQVYKTNRNITELTSVRQKLPMLAEYLKMDFTKYYK
jgi:hypothetical protein